MAIKYYKETQYTVFCAKCGSSESVYTSDEVWKYNDTPTGYFKRQGWSDKTGVTLCPDCTRIHKPEQE
jgi:hypothetical protein